MEEERGVGAWRDRGQEAGEERQGGGNREKLHNNNYITFCNIAQIGGNH